MSFENVVIDVRSARDFVPKVDAKIRRIKEVYRSVKAAIPWKLPLSLVKDLVAYAVSRINVQRATAISQNDCPRVMFTGKRVDYRKELSLAFDNYCKVIDSTDNMLKQKSAPCIALYPCCDATGLWPFFSIIPTEMLETDHLEEDGDDRSCGATDECICQLGEQSGEMIE
jgi:hypothetical protein